MTNKEKEERITFISERVAAANADDYDAVEQFNHAHKIIISAMRRIIFEKLRVKEHAEVIDEKVLAGLPVQIRDYFEAQRSQIPEWFKDRPVQVSGFSEDLLDLARFYKREIAAEIRSQEEKTLSQLIEPELIDWNKEAFDLAATRFDEVVR